jgi:hypothetical protein
MTTVALRTALIWDDEVMDDVVLEKPTKVTVGSSGKPTFIVPNVGLPKEFAIVRPGNRGYLLTLGDKMRGTICVDGEQKDVAEFVRRGGEGDTPGGFRATPISGKDWGVIDLDDSGHYKLFFQFVPIEDAQPFFTKPVLLAGLAGYLISIAVLAGIFYWRGIPECNLHGKPFGCYDFTLAGSDSLAQLVEALFRAWGIATGALALSGVVWWITKQNGDQQASLTFSIMMHAALLLMTYQLYDGTDSFVWPGSRVLTANYLATRLEKPPDPPKVPTVGEKTQQQSTAAMKSPEPNKKTAAKNPEGAAGGKGEHERARDKNGADEPSWRDTPLDKRNRVVLDQFDQHLKTDLDKFMKGDQTKSGDFGYGHGTGTGVGDFANGFGATRGSKGHGSGGNGHAEGDFVSDKGKIDTGGERPGGGNCAKPPCGNSPKEVKVTMTGAEGDLGGLTRDEIDRVVKARAGVFRACYQKELNRSPGIGGKVEIHFVIGGDGHVQSSKTAGSSTMRNENVESCVNSNIMRLVFPAKGGLATVNYPFLFQPGG